jgi:3-oxoadipate enol-lactonase
VETVVLIPAAAATGQMWRPQTEALAGRFDVLICELPGHGTVPGPFTMDRAVHQVMTAIEQASAPVHLCGISLSATVAVLTCLARPARIRSLILSGGMAHPPAALTIQRALVAVMPERLLLRVTAQQQGRSARGLPDRQRAALVARAVEDFQATGKSTFRAALRELARVDLRPRLGGITVPTLVLCGDRDRVNLPGARELAAGIPHAELRVVPGAGHLWNLEQPELFSTTVADFVWSAERA